jgi:hypothetical protein
MMPKVKIEPMPLQSQSTCKALPVWLPFHMGTKNVESKKYKYTYMSNFKHFYNITQLHNFVLKSIENIINFIACFNSY